MFVLFDYSFVNAICDVYTAFCELLYYDKSSLPPMVVE